VRRAAAAAGRVAAGIACLALGLWLLLGLLAVALTLFGGEL
jgi:hypothetical protein